jgi:hypothetical protein
LFTPAMESAKIRKSNGNEDDVFHSIPLKC